MASTTAHDNNSSPPRLSTDSVAFVPNGGKEQFVVDKIASVNRWVASTGVEGNVAGSQEGKAGLSRSPSSTFLSSVPILPSPLPLPSFPSSPPLLPPTHRSLSAYLVALRPWSFTASLTPVALGSCLAYKESGEFSPTIFALVCLTTLSVHAAGNLVNTYYDYTRGVDSKKSDDRTLVDSVLTPHDVVSMGGFFYAAGCVGFLALALLSSARMEHLALVYFGGLSSSFLYTGGLGLKYVALGDLLIMLTFGPLTVLFAFAAQGAGRGALSLAPLAYAIPLALNTEAILHSNNARDRETDAAAGIVTLAILMGKAGSYCLFTFLLFSPYIAFAVLALNFSVWFLLPLATLAFTFRYERLFRQGALDRMPHDVAKLNLVIGVCYVAACTLTDTSQMPGLH